MGQESIHHGEEILRRQQNRLQNPWGLHQQAPQRIPFLPPVCLTAESPSS